MSDETSLRPSGGEIITKPRKHICPNCGLGHSIYDDQGWSIMWCVSCSVPIERSDWLTNPTTEKDHE